MILIFFYFFLIFFPTIQNPKSKLIIPVEHYFLGRVTIKGTSVMTKIKQKFEKYGLMEKAKECPFKQFFVAPPMQASGVLLRYLLLMMVKSRNPMELQFYIRDNNLRFRLGEFALITALNFGKDPDLLRLKSMSGSTRLRETYLNNEAMVRSGELEVAFLNCEEKEDVWKLGLCYLVDGVLMEQDLGDTGVEAEGIEGDEEDENNKEAAEAKQAADEAGIFDTPTDELEKQPSDDLPWSHTFYIELKTDITELKAN
ncbi:hypothetical protein TorRG33x02_170030 [Trema orientale]|uniref:DUF1985 domain-containing protein n=1 Tax=Trema orientale TaxID=63057 RepID=A0A2P5ENV7_TREOI|nr:hypothetical protein TorRG33x02_170030 [Trema orientale]